MLKCAMAKWARSVEMESTSLPFVLTWQRPQRGEEATIGEIGTEWVKVRFPVSAIEATSALGSRGTK